MKTPTAKLVSPNTSPLSSVNAVSMPAPGLTSSSSSSSPSSSEDTKLAQACLHYQKAMSLKEDILSLQKLISNRDENKLHKDLSPKVFALASEHLNSSM